MSHFRNNNNNKEDYEIRHLKKVCFHNNQQSHKREDEFLSAGTKALVTWRGWFTPPLAAEPQKMIDHYPGANKPESLNFVTNQGFSKLALLTKCLQS